MKEKTIRRNLHCEYTAEHFKMFTISEELGLTYRIYAFNEEGEKTTLIFNGLREMYESQGMNTYDAAIRARAVVKDFFTVCQKLSDKKKRPFIMKIDVLDLTLYNHGKQVSVHGRSPNEGQLGQGSETLQLSSEDKQLLNDGVPTPKVGKSKGDKQLSKNRRRNSTK